MSGELQLLAPYWPLDGIDILSFHRYAKVKTVMIVVNRSHIPWERIPYLLQFCYRMYPAQILLFQNELDDTNWVACRDQSHLAGLQKALSEEVEAGWEIRDEILVSPNPCSRGCSVSFLVNYLKEAQKNQADSKAEQPLPSQRPSFPSSDETQILAPYWPATGIDMFSFSRDEEILWISNRSTIPWERLPIFIEFCYQVYSAEALLFDNEGRITNYWITSRNHALDLRDLRLALNQIENGWEIHDDILVSPFPCKYRPSDLLKKYLKECSLLVHAEKISQELKAGTT